MNLMESDLEAYYKEFAFRNYICKRFSELSEDEKLALSKTMGFAVFRLGKASKRFCDEANKLLVRIGRKI